MNNRPLTPSVFHATLNISASIIVRNEEENIAAMCGTMVWASAFRD